MTLDPGEAIGRALSQQLNPATRPELPQRAMRQAPQPPPRKQLNEHELRVQGFKDAGWTQRQIGLITAASGPGLVLHWPTQEHADAALAACNALRERRCLILFGPHGSGLSSLLVDLGALCVKEKLLPERNPTQAYRSLAFGDEFLERKAGEARSGDPVAYNAAITYLDGFRPLARYGDHDDWAHALGVVRYRYDAMLPTVLTANRDREGFAEVVPAHMRGIFEECYDIVEMPGEVRTVLPADDAWVHRAEVAPDPALEPVI